MYGGSHRGPQIRDLYTGTASEVCKVYIVSVLLAVDPFRL